NSKLSRAFSNFKRINVNILRSVIIMKYFKNVTTLEELKKQYRKLAKQYHPDLNENDTTKDMQQINKEYEILFDQLKNNKSNTENEKASTYMNIINELIKYEDITIDIVGSWLWLSGDTYPIKNELSKLGFRWSK